MNQLMKLVLAIFITVVLLVTVFFVFNISDKPEATDVQAPSIDSVTGNTTGTTGKITTIVASFSDNEEVTEAVIYYKSASSKDWNFDSIINGSFDIQIPKSPIEDWYYYITVDDAAGNGPVGNPSIDGSIFYTISVKEDRKELVHNVFIEEGTTTWCHNCPDVADILHELYESGNYNFYYVSMIGDKNYVANDRLSKDYNIVGYPTVFVDGGYKIIVGDKEKTEFESAIITAQDRTVPQITINVTADYNNETNELTTNVLVKNYEEKIYTGQLKVYLTEKTSRWINTHKTSQGKTVPYHYGFIDFVIDEKASVESKDDTIITDKRKLTDVSPEDITLIAVMFSLESVKKYSFPPDQGEFDAYYADATDAAELTSTINERPVVYISNLEYKKLHVFGKPLFETLFKNTVLIGKTKVIVEAQDDSGIDKVEFYIDDKLQYTDKEAPYEYTLTKLNLFKEFFLRKHKITVVAHDDTGKTTSVDLEVLVRL